MSPTSGSAAGGDQVTITGTELTDATEVDFGGTAATGVSVVFGPDGNLQVTCISPAGAGVVDVTVTTPAGQSATTPDDEFTYDR